MKENMSSRGIRWMAPVMLGGAAAILTTVLMSRAEQGAQAKAAEIKLPAPQQAAEGTPDANKVHDLEKRLAELEASKAAQEEPSSASNSQSAEGPPVMNPREIAKELQQQQDVRLAMHASELLDPSWSSRAVSSFQDDLVNLSKNGAFKITDVECKTTSCIASVEWPNYDDAQRENGTLTIAAYKVNCARQIYVPEPQDREAPYRATLIFDCAQSRQDPTATLQ